MRFIAFILTLMFVQISFAHPGVTDDNGCHINSDTGRKHCHKAKEKKTQTTEVQKPKKKKPKKEKS